MHHATDTAVATDPAAARLRERAAVIRAIAFDAERLADDLADLRRLADRVTWVGPTADRFNEFVDRHVSAIGVGADELRRAARRLDMLAASIATG